MSALGLGMALARSAAPDLGLTPPSLAPVLSVSAEFGSKTANLEWTASNKTTSLGFGYEIQVYVNNTGWSIVTTTTSLSYDYTEVAAEGETYIFKIIPFNAFGGGPESNEASVILPGV